MLDKQRGKDKLAKIPIKIIPSEPIAKPSWIKVVAKHHDKVTQIKNLLREHNLHSVCEEAACPNLPECFGSGTATFMIMGDRCTRRCAFCDVAHGRPLPLDKNEPENLAKALAKLGLSYIVITSVDRDDLLDGGAQHFADCINAIRHHLPRVNIEILVPDFRGRMDKALPILSQSPPNVFNHNIETVPSLYKAVRPGSDYHGSLQLLEQYASLNPNIPTKSGLMLGLGEDLSEVKQVIQDLFAHKVNMLTIGQYLQPSRYHAKVQRYVTPAEFKDLEVFAQKVGFSQVASGPLVRSSYHAEQQAGSMLGS